MNLLNNLQQFIESPLVNVNFAGFRANTYQLAQNGWALSASEMMSPVSGEREIQLVMKHEGGLVLISAVRFMKYDYMLSSIPAFDFNVMGASIKHQSSFLIRPKSIDIDFEHKKFNAIDHVPEVKTIDLNNFSFEDFCLFRPLNDSANIYVPEAKVSELMEVILEKQASDQKDIRERRRKEGLRHGVADLSRNSTDKIKAQLIAI